MTKPTTEELKDLLGKVTPDWAEARECEMEEYWVGHTHWSAGPVCGSAGSESDATLIALATRLAAEVVELREALEWLDDMLFEHGFSYDGLMRDRISQALDATSAEITFSECI